MNLFTIIYYRKGFSQPFPRILSALNFSQAVITFYSQMDFAQDELISLTVYPHHEARQS